MHEEEKCGNDKKCYALEIGVLLGEETRILRINKMADYIDFALNRFLTPGVTDTVARISRAPIRKLGHEDRLGGDRSAM